MITIPHQKISNCNTTTRKKDILWNVVFPLWNTLYVMLLAQKFWIEWWPMWTVAKKSPTLILNQKNDCHCNKEDILIEQTSTEILVWPVYLTYKNYMFWNEAMRICLFCSELYPLLKFSLYFFNCSYEFGCLTVFRIRIQISIHPDPLHLAGSGSI